MAHPLKGRKKSAASIAKLKATLAEKRKLREAGVLPKQKRKSRKRVETRNFEQLVRDVNEARWCIEQAVTRTRSKIATGELSISEVTDEETYLYMAARYLDGGLKP